MALAEYRRKRNAEQTPEPFGESGGPRSDAVPQVFIVQKHSARRLHYDFRLAMEGVLRSWAVPKGPSLDPADKRLAVMVEDHPLEYADFEGIIPEGNYGAGSVIVWDRGSYRLIDPPGGDPAAAVRKGKLDLELHGFKLAGAFTLVRTGLHSNRSQEKENWLLIKKRDEFSDSKRDILRRERSVLSGLTNGEVSEAPALAARISGDLERAGAKRFAGSLNGREFPFTLAQTADEPFDDPSWLFEIKYDGVRALVTRDGGAVRIFGRNGNDITGRYPELARCVRALPFARVAIDGEIVAFNDGGRPDFQLLQHRMHVNDRGEAERLSLTIPVALVAFDLIAFGDYDLRGLALERRKSLLAEVIRNEGPIRLSEYLMGEGRKFFDAIAAVKLEGIMAKRRDSLYRGTRSGDWLKIKCARTGRFVIGGYTDPQGARAHFGALLLGLWDERERLRFVGKVGTGFSDALLTKLFHRLVQIGRRDSPFKAAGGDQRKIFAHAHFCEPQLVCEVRFAEVTEDNSVRHPSFIKLVDADPAECRFVAPFGMNEIPMTAMPEAKSGGAVVKSDSAARRPKASGATVEITNADKIFWPSEGYTKGDLVEYYREIARWMLPYLKDRPVMIVRYPEGIEGKNFYQKDAPAFAPDWIRTEKIYSEDSNREIAHFIIESEEALCYVANLGTIPIHIWSSRIGSLENPDWLLFDMDPKGSTTAKAIAAAKHLAEILRKIGLRPVVKTSGQAGLHVMVGLVPAYSYQQARDFSELVAQVAVAEHPDLMTIERNTHRRKGRVYIDYLQLGQGKTIAAPFAVRALAGAPVSAPIKLAELSARLRPEAYNIKTMAARMKRIGRDPFRGVLDDRQELERALPGISKALGQPEDRA